MLTEHFTTAHWWIAAVVSGLALATAGATLATTRRAKVAGAVTVTAVTGLYTGLKGTGDGAVQALQLYILGTLSLAILRLVFAGWLRRQRERHEAGEPPEQPTARHIAVFLATFAAIVAGIAVTL
ncbi:hypothetical protein [Streptomyces sp. N35]|uniref:hypothetical protein n=1 Tax=Streptomyces sp. N35 TaxID=2795730 RepID=UPI0018F485B4|nr:hypothetical protein [Streptomyces sp. N35]